MRLLMNKNLTIPRDTLRKRDRRRLFHVGVILRKNRYGKKIWRDKARMYEKQLMHKLLTLQD